MPDTKQILEALSSPLDPLNDLEWRIQHAGELTGNKLFAVVVPYVTNRAIMDRLDEVCGPANWYNQFSYPTDKAILCGLSIKLGEEWLTKWDGAEETHIEAVKGGISSAMKRAAVQWGIGRYLYRLEAQVVTLQTDKPQTLEGFLMARGVTINGKKIKQVWYPRPKLPKFALPA